MKTYVRITILSVLLVLTMLAVYMMRRVSAPESAIIAHERDAIYAARDKNRMEKDPTYAIEMRERLQFLDLRTAAAHIAENNPDEAIAIIQKLIAEEEAHAKVSIGGRSRTYVNEVRFYEMLMDAYELKKDEAGAQKAKEAHDALLLKAKRRESGKAGKKEAGRIARGLARLSPVPGRLRLVKAFILHEP
jgi:hypothetical protein